MSSERYLVYQRIHDGQMFLFLRTDIEANGDTQGFALRDETRVDVLEDDLRKDFRVVACDHYQYVDYIMVLHRFEEREWARKCRARAAEAAKKGAEIKVLHRFEEREWRARRKMQRAAEKCRQEAIQKIVKDRGIKQLVHFTRVENLPGIFEHGLLSRVVLRKRTLKHWINDENRQDGRLDGISVSISFPNYRMFFKYHQGEGGYAVIIIDPVTLWENQCCFYPTNAASAHYRQTSPSSAADLEAMFDDEETRKSLALLPRETTNPQAEVLVFEEIPIDRITSVAFYSEVARRRSALSANIQAVIEPQFFKPRRDYEHWRSL
jgi:hypothetical protein